MGRAMVARLGLGLLLLALLLPTQIYCNQTSVAPFSGNQNISASPNPNNATTRGGGSSLQSTAGLLSFLLSHLFCFLMCIIKFQRFLLF
uniref:CD24 n=1 Tax=Mus spicilegus TaxID=10103 RepID=A0A8C6N2K6_MUSSI